MRRVCCQQTTRCDHYNRVSIWLGRGAAAPTSTYCAADPRKIRRQRITPPPRDGNNASCMRWRRRRRVLGRSTTQYSKATWCGLRSRTAAAERGWRCRARVESTSGSSLIGPAACRPRPAPRASIGPRRPRRPPTDLRQSDDWARGDTVRTGTLRANSQTARGDTVRSGESGATVKIRSRVRRSERRFGERTLIRKAED